MQTCRSCGERNPDRARFCMMCATPLGASSSVGETRRVVTILFADVSGSTAIGERLDPEAVRRVLSTFYSSARAALERHGGTVEKFIGDAVMAVFGVPRVHEDDAQRAVRAAAELLDVMVKMNAALIDRYGAELQLRIGVNTGEVVAGDPSTGSSFVAGDAVNVAARLEQTATPGTVFLGSETYDLARDIATAEPVEPLTLKGKREAVPAYRLIELKDDDGRADVPFVGRAAELATIAAALDAAGTGATSRRVVVTGPAGIGKSRLLEEAAVRALGRAQAIRARCRPEGERTVLGPIGDLIVSAVGLGIGAGLDAIEHEMQRLLGEGERTDLAVTAVRSVVGGEGTPDAAWSVAEILHAAASIGPTIVEIDDAHLASAAVLEILDDVRERTARDPILWIDAWRSGETDEHPVDAVILPLDPLDPSEARELVSTAFGLPAVPVDRIVAAAEGNPLFLVETARLVAERGGDATELPSTIRSLFAARVDELSDRERGFLQTAATVGREASVRLIEELDGSDDGDIVDGLVRAGLIASTADTVSFSHASLRDVVYAGMTKERRADLHERIADVLEREGGSPVVLAHHLDRATVLRAELGAPDDHDRTLSARAATAIATVAIGRLAQGERAAALDALARGMELARIGQDDDASLAVAELAFRLGRWPETASLLEPLDARPETWNRLGVALVKRSSDGDVERGRAYLTRAARAGDIDAAAALAGTWKGVDDDRAYEGYLAALELDPADPYALGNVLELEIARTGDLSAVADRRPALASAVLRRRGQALAGEDRPWSFFDLGKFELLLGEEECLSSFAAAVGTSSAAYMVETSLRSLERIRAACTHMPGYEWSVRLLSLGLAAGSAGTVHEDGRTVILVGGSSVEGGGRIASYREALVGALGGEAVTIISGGTAQGVSALAGDVSEILPAVRAVGYLPSVLPEGVTADERYDELRPTDGKTFSALEPLTYWDDILGVTSPASVAVVAMGGGRLTALEIRLALALGARVGAVAGSGGASAAIVGDRTWATSPLLAEVEPSAEGLRAFLFAETR